MKKMKKTLSLLLCVVMLAGMFPVSAFAAEDVPAEPPAQTGQQPASPADTQQQSTECQHTGGVATCTALAVCEACGAAYGELAAHSGGSATCTAQAVCEACEQPYGELAEHSFAEGKCANCGAADPDYVAPCEHSYGEEGNCTLCGEAKPAEPPEKRAVKAVPAVSASPELGENLVYNRQPQTLATAAEGSLVSLNGETWASSVTATDAGDYTVYYKSEIDGVSPEVGQVTVTINRLLLSFTPQPKKYFDGDIVFETSQTLGGNEGVLGDDKVVFEATYQFPGKDTGTYVIHDGRPVTLHSFTLSGADSGNYSVPFKSGDVFDGRINPLPLTVKVKNSSKPYLSPDPEFGFEVTSDYVSNIGAVLAGCPLELSISREAGEALGSYMVSADHNRESGLPVNTNYSLSFVPGRLDITGRKVTLAGVKAVTKGYDGTTDTTIDFSSAYLENLPEGYTIEVSPKSLPGVFDSADAGPRTARRNGFLTIEIYNAEGESERDNFSILVPASFPGVIEPAILDVVYTGEISKEYDGESAVTLDPAKLSYLNLPDGLSVEFTSASGSFESADAGKHSLSISAEGIVRDAGGNDVSQNFFFRFSDAEGEIKPRPISANIRVLSKSYDGSSNISWEPAGFDNAIAGKEPGLEVKGRYLLGGAEQKDAAEYLGYDIISVTLSGENAANYVLTEYSADAEAGLSIEPRPITVTANDISKSYGDPDPELTYTASGLVEGEALKGTPARISGEDVDTYMIDCGTLLSQNPNYSISFTPGEFTIVPRIIYVRGMKADDRDYNGRKETTISYEYESYRFENIPEDEEPYFGISATGFFEDANAGENKPVTAEIYLTYIAPGYKADNYTFVSKSPLSATIRPVRREVRMTGGLSKSFGEDDPVFTHANLGSDTETGLDFVVKVSREEGQDLGAYAFIFEEDYINYEFYTSSVFKILPRVVTVRPAGDVTVPYGDTAEIPYVVRDSEGNKLPLTLSGSLSRSEGEAPGSYAIGQGSITDTDNPGYFIIFENPEGYDYTITRRKVFINGLTALDKDFDNTPAAAIDTMGHSLSGDGYEALPLNHLISMPVTLPADFKDRYAGEQEILSAYFTGIKVYKGLTDVTSYFEFALGETLKATIRPVTLTIEGITVNDKDYDGSTDATYTGSISGFKGLSSDYLYFTDGLQLAFADADAGENKEVIVSGLQVNSTDSLTDLSSCFVVAPLYADIRKAAPELEGIRAESFAYCAYPRPLASYSSFSGGEIFWSLGTADAPGSQWLSEIPEATEVGKYYLWYKVVGDANHTDIAPSLLESEISPAVLYFTNEEPYSKVYDGTADCPGILVPDSNFPSGLSLEYDAVYWDYAAKSPISAAGRNYSITIDNIRLSGENAGNYVLRYHDAYEEDLAPDFSIVTFGHILPREITVTPTMHLWKTYGDPDPELSYTVTGLLPGDSLSGALSREEGENVGFYSVEIGTLANPNYEIKLDSEMFTIKQRKITISGITAETREYDGTTNATIDINTLDPVFSNVPAGESFYMSVDSATYEDPDAGENKSATPGPHYIIWVTDGYDINNYEFVFAPITGTITPRPITLTANNVSKTYGEDDPNLTYGVTEGQMVDSDTFTGAPSRDAGEDAGVYDITIGTLANPNYNITFIPGKLTITKAVSSISFADYAPGKTYDGTALAVPAETELNISGALYTDVTYTWYKDSVSEANRLNAAPKDAGSYVLVATIPDSSNTSSSSAESGLITISPAPVTVTPTDMQKVYLDPDRVIEYTAEGLIPGETLSGALSREAGEELGPYDVTIGTLQSENPNYNITLKPGVVTIKPRVIYVRGVSAEDKVYDGTTHATLNLQAVELGNLPEAYPDAITALELMGIFYTADAGEDKYVDVSLVDFTVREGLDKDGFIFSVSDTSADITPLPIEITVYQSSKYYSDAEPGEFSYSVEPYVSLELEISREAGENVGEYDFILETELKNHTASFANSFLIERKPIDTIVYSAAIYNGEYTGEEIDCLLEFEFEGGLVEGRDYTVSGNIQTAVGTHVVTFTGIGNYCDEQTLSFEILPPSVIRDVLDGTVTPETVMPEDYEELKLLEDALATIDEDTEHEDLDQWKHAAEKLAPIIDALEELEALVNSENIKAAEDINADNVTVNDKETIENAKDDIEKLLDEHSGKLDAGTVAELEDKLETIEETLDTLEDAESIISEIEKWLKDNKDKFDADELKLREEYKDIMDNIDALNANAQRIVKDAVGAGLKAAEAKLYTYKIISGDGANWVKGSGATLDFTANGAVSLFDHLLVDGKKLDAANYTVSSGSTIVKLKADYLQALVPGKHNIQFVYTDGSTNVVEFIVGYTISGTVQTGDSSNPALWLSLMLSSLAAIVVSLPRLKRRKEEN